MRPKYKDKSTRRKVLLKRSLEEHAKKHGLKGSLRDSVMGLASENAADRWQEVRNLIDQVRRNSEVGLEPVTAMLRDRNATVRAEAAYALGEGLHESSLKPVAARLNDKNADVRANAARALYKIANSNGMQKQAFPRLKKCLLEELAKGKKDEKVIDNCLNGMKILAQKTPTKYSKAGALEFEQYQREIDEVVLAFLRQPGMRQGKQRALDVLYKLKRKKGLKQALDLAFKDENSRVGLHALKIVGRRYEDFLSGKDLKKAQVADKFLEGHRGRAVALGMIVLRKDVRRLCPLSLNDVKGRAYLTSLRNDANKKREPEELKEIIRWEKGLK
jgi:hypothetical protein